jgi:hypothetical protein
MVGIHVGIHQKQKLVMVRHVRRIVSSADGPSGRRAQRIAMGAPRNARSSSKKKLKERGNAQAHGL